MENKMVYMTKADYNRGNTFIELTVNIRFILSK